MSETILRVKRVISYSEIQAVKAIYNAIGEKTDAIIVSKNVADNEGITRSVVVAGLKILEVAGIVETRSLGMKGTNIKILDRKSLEEVIK